MRLGLQDVDWAYVGAELARDDDHMQTKFFKGFIKECLSWGTKYQVESQLACVNRKLTLEERELLSMLSYIEGGD